MNGLETIDDLIVLSIRRKSKLRLVDVREGDGDSRLLEIGHSGGNLVVLGVAVLATGIGDEVGTVPENDGVVICQIGLLEGYYAIAQSVT